ncbi:MAG: hypothetical protein II771_05555, partial [Clostridia bacterium]|nr:hypothetical protein [Clostridia bacterium]
MENEATPKCRVCGSTDVGARYDGQSFCRSCGAVVAPCAVCGSYDIVKSHDGTFFCRACGARGSALDGKAKAGKPSLSGKKRTFLVIGAILAALLIAVIVLFATGVFGGGSLIGKWAFGANHWQFNDDGTFSANVNTLNYEGTYTAEDGKLHIDTDFFGLKKSLDYDYAIKGKKLTLTGDVTLTGAGSMTLEYERISNKSASSGKKPGDTTAAPTNDPATPAEETGKAGTTPDVTTPVDTTNDSGNIAKETGKAGTTSGITIPARFSLASESAIRGGVAVLTAENAADPSKITFTSSPALTYEGKEVKPVFYSDGTTSRALIVMDPALASASYEFTLTYGAVTQTLTLTTDTSRYNAYRSGYESDAKNTATTHSPEALAALTDLLASLAERSAKTPLWSGKFVEINAVSYAMGFGHSCRIAATGETYENRAVEYNIAKG